MSMPLLSSRTEGSSSATGAGGEGRGGVSLGGGAGAAGSVSTGAMGSGSIWGGAAGEFAPPEEFDFRKDFPVAPACDQFFISISVSTSSKNLRVLSIDLRIRSFISASCVWY